MDLDKLKASGIKPYIMVDTCDFIKYCIAIHGYNNESFHKEIWDKFMCDDFLDGKPYKHYNFMNEPKNKKEELVNQFLTDFPEFNNNIYFIFTN